MKSALSAATSAAKLVANLALSSARKPPCGGRSGEYGRARRGVLDQAGHRLATIRGERRNVHKARDVWGVAGSVITTPP